MSDLEWSIEDGAAVIRFNRPAARNALTFEMVAGLLRMVEHAQDDAEVRALVLTGAGSEAFCSGMDTSAIIGVELTPLERESQLKDHVQLLTGDSVTAAEALRIGLVNRVVESEDLAASTIDFARSVARHAPVPTAMMKRAVYQCARSDLRTALELLSSHYAVAASTRDSEEAIAALRERDRRYSKDVDDVFVCGGARRVVALRAPLA